MKQIPYRLAEALETICKSKTLENITVSQIAQKAEVTRQVFYHYFDDKFELASWIHYMHLYQSLKKAMEEGTQHVWRQTVTYWLKQMKKNKAFYMNVFQSTSQKEFQRIIRDFFLRAYKWQIEHSMERQCNKEEEFVLHSYLYGAMECIYEWVGDGMSMPAERLTELLELAMPQLIKQGITSGEHVPYKEALKGMEKFLADEGLLQGIS